MKVKVKKGGFQDRLLRSTSRYVAAICGYGSGKTFIGALKSIILSKENAPCDGLVVSHDWNIQNTVIIPQIQAHLDDMGIPYEYAKADQILKMPWGKMIFRVGSKPIVGFTVGWAWMDEACLMPDTAWKDVLARVRDKHSKKPQIFITSTPEGLGGFVYENFIEDPLHGVELIQGSTLENKYLHPDFIKSLDGAYSDKLKAAYIHGEFVDFSSDSVYCDFDRNKHVVESETVPYGIGHINIYNFSTSELILSCDFGSVIGAWVVMKKIELRGMTIIVVLDEVFQKVTSTNDMVEEFVRRFGNSNVHLRVHGDATGAHTRASVSTKTDYQIIERVCRDAFASVTIDVPKANPPVISRINNVNSGFRGSQNFRVIISPKCKNLIKDLLRVRYSSDGSRRIDKSDRELTHISDAFAYGMWQFDTPLREFNRGGYSGTDGLYV